MIQRKTSYLLLAALLCFVAKAEVPALTGTIVKDQSGEFLTFDLKLKSGNVSYRVEGNTVVDAGIYQSHTKFDGVTVTKLTETSDGRTLKQGLQNYGKARVYPRKRFVSNAKLADVSLEGYYLQGMIDRGMWVDHLTVDGKPSKGVLDYIIVNGRYRALKNLSFGEYGISSTKPNSKICINRDNYIGQNNAEVSMTFGDLRLSGQIQYTDITKTYGSGDSTTTVLGARMARFQVPITFRDGGALKLAEFGRAETDDDKAVRHLIAFLELMGFDLFTQ